MKYVTKMCIYGDYGVKFCEKWESPEYVVIYDTDTRKTNKVLGDDLVEYCKSNYVYGILCSSFKNNVRIDNIWVTPSYALSLYDCIDFSHMKRNSVVPIDQLTSGYKKLTNDEVWAILHQNPVKSGPVKALKKSSYTLFSCSPALPYTLSSDYLTLAGYIVWSYKTKSKASHMVITDDLIEITLFDYKYYYKILDRKKFNTIITKAITTIKG